MIEIVFILNLFSAEESKENARVCSVDISSAGQGKHEEKRPRRRQSKRGNRKKPLVPKKTLTLLEKV